MEYENKRERDRLVYSKKDLVKIVWNLLSVGWKVFVLITHLNVFTLEWWTTVCMRIFKHYEDVLSNFFGIKLIFSFIPVKDDNYK
jgi:hypothetical protein